MTTLEQYVTKERLARAKTLREAGWVHVTGLRTWSVRGESYTIQVNRPGSLDRWDYNNGTKVLVTEDGEVWLGCHAARIPEGMAPKEGAFVPCSNGEQLNLHDVLHRIANPYDGSNGIGCPVPEMQKS